MYVHVIGAQGMCVHYCVGCRVRVTCWNDAGASRARMLADNWTCSPPGALAQKLYADAAALVVACAALCSVWYELAYIESMSGLKAGQRVWQLAFGSGFKFNSAVLVANRNFRTFHPAWDGFDSNVSDTHGLIIGVQSRGQHAIF